MKITIRVPDELHEDLLQRSREEGRSMNATAVAAMWKGLGRELPSEDASSVLGSLIVRRATAKYDPEAVADLRKQLGEAAYGLDEALEWTREDRC